jgi:bis(5'-nucleosyl)-tetraphosphatase (symmetrical)
MARYVLGDIQGCFESLQALLGRLDFDPRHDRLVLAGDLVNRGPRSLDVLRWVAAHRSRVDFVLGNHDVHLLVLAAGLDPDRPDLAFWLDAARRASE